MYNNYINSSNNYENHSTWPESIVNYFNTTLTAGTNIIGGPYIGGNYWTNYTGDDFSDTCNDTDHDGICDSSFDIENKGVYYDYLPLAEDNHPPNIDLVPPTPDNEEFINDDYVEINVSTSDANNHSAFLDWNKSLELWLNFENDNSSNIYDNSTYGRNGSISGGNSSVTGIYGFLPRLAKLIMTRPPSTNLGYIS